MQHPVAAGNRKIYRRQKMGFVLIHIAYFFPKATRCVILFLLHFNKFFKTLLTHSTCRGIFLVNPFDFVDWFKFIHKMWSCSFWTQPQKVVGYHRETHHFSEGKSAKEFTAPQHTRFILPPIPRQNPSLRGRYFSFRELHLENFMSRPNVIPTFRQRRCKTGVGTSFGANGDPITWAEPRYLFFAS